jgi:hypothetical protein
LALVIATTTLPLRPHRRGKVRDVYELDDDRLLLVASDRVSAFDVVMRELVPVQGDRADADHGVVAQAASSRSSRTTCSRRP